MKPVERVAIVGLGLMGGSLARALAAQTDLLLCRDDCAGLCPRCGADLNAGPCACRTAAAEPV